MTDDGGRSWSKARTIAATAGVVLTCAAVVFGTGVRFGSGDTQAVQFVKRLDSAEAEIRELRDVVHSIDVSLMQIRTRLDLEPRPIGERGTHASKTAREP